MEKTEKPDKPRKVFWSNFIMLMAPLCVWAEIALIIAGMGGAHDGTWVASVKGAAFPIVWTLWFVAVGFSVEKNIRAFVPKGLTESESWALAYANLMNVPTLLIFLTSGAPSALWRLFRSFFI